MKHHMIAALLLSSSLLSSPALGKQAAAREAPLPKELKVSLGGVKEGEAIPAKLAFCTADGKGATKDGGNRNPSVNWTKGPAETKSYVLLVVDKDVPASFELANQKGKVIPEKFKRQDFYHWALVDIPANVTGVPQGKLSRGVIKGGKKPGKTAYGTQGQNDYATFMEGTYGGYDGPCPPWNDERLHHYYFQVYALDVKELGLKEGFTGKDVLKALDGHIVGKGETVGTYSTNPKLLK
jgi:Raf kinase inhibitor-like YbhB/YbcL family protein